ncbi:MAG TPA: hypothetical protein PKO34_00970 [Smithellaceae bacterium]|nr:MAG: hypothetical protein BWY15_02305 [Firmicutes bacterium ADurb.Bin193]HNS55597.1 hypothetical protein [Smithellaceae bacterium]
MKFIETTEQLIAWAKEVNNGVSLSRKCDLQDIIGHSNTERLKELFISANGSRNLITCSFYNTMSYDFVEEMLLALAKHKAQALIDKESERLETEWTERFVLLEKREERLKDGKTVIYKKIATLKNTLARLESKLEREKDENAVLRKKKMELSGEVERLSADAKRFNIIKSLLSPPPAVREVSQ